MKRREMEAALDRLIKEAQRVRAMLNSSRSYSRDDIFEAFGEVTDAHMRVLRASGGEENPDEISEEQRRMLRMPPDEYNREDDPVNR